MKINILLFLKDDKKNRINNYLLFLSFFILLVAGCTGSDSGSGGLDKTDSVGSTNKITDTSKLNDLSTSKDIEAVLAQDWVMDDDIEAVNFSDEPMALIAYRSFYFSPDHSFISNPRNDIGSGIWAYTDDNKTIRLQYADGKTGLYKIKAVKSTELRLVNTGISSETELKYISGGVNYKHTADDPYHITNNAWRFKPAKAETEDEINTRLKGWLMFHILFYRDAILKNVKQISFYGFPTCVKWYGGGVVMRKQDELPQNWIDCFYNKQQALNAYALMDKVFKKKYVFPKDVNWVKKNLSVIEQMYKNL